MPRMSSVRRVVSVVSALVAATAFAIAVEGGHWWSIGADVHVGPLATERCFGGECGSGSLAWAGGGDSWERAGFATYVGGLCAAAMLVALAGALAAKRSGRLLAAVVGVSLCVVGAAGASFVTLRPALPGATIDRGAIAFAIAIIVAIATVIVVVRTRAPAGD
jgi:hypothetical protein